MSEISVAANSSLNIFTAIRLWKPSLSKTENRIADYFYNHPQEAANQSMLKVAEICHCGEGSIDRFCKKWDIPVLHRLKKCWRLKTQLLKPLCSRLILSNMTL